MNYIFIYWTALYCISILIVLPGEKPEPTPQVFNPFMMVEKSHRISWLWIGVDVKCIKHLKTNIYHWNSLIAVKIFTPAQSWTNTEQFMCQYMPTTESWNISLYQTLERSAWSANYTFVVTQCRGWRFVMQIAIYPHAQW